MKDHAHGGCYVSPVNWAPIFATISTLLFVSCGFGTHHPAAPNVILIVIDTLRADHLSGYGYYRDTTPVLDALMKEGVRFDAAIAPGSWAERPS